MCNICSEKLVSKKFHERKILPESWRLTGNGTRCIKWFFSLVMISASCAVSADELWSNGGTDGSYLGWGQNSSVLDDVYVPGGGWWIDRLQLSGFYLNGESVDDVQVRIWSHSSDENGPTGDSTKAVKVKKFSTKKTGNKYFGYDEIKVTAILDKTYLKGQKFHWIEIAVINQYGEKNFSYLGRKGISLQPSWILVGSVYPAPGETYSGEQKDLAFVLHGKPVKSNFSNVLPIQSNQSFDGLSTTQRPNQHRDGSSESRDTSSLFCTLCKAQGFGCDGGNQRCTYKIKSN